MSGESVAQDMQERIARATADVGEHDLEALLVTGAVNVRYITGFTGTSGVAIVAAGDAAPTGAHRRGRPLRHRFITDFRYATQSRGQVSEPFALEVVTDDLFEAVAAALADGGGRLGFLEKNLTVAEHARLRELLGEPWELVPSGEILAGLRTVKDAGEIARIRCASCSKPGSSGAARARARSSSSCRCAAAAPKDRAFLPSWRPAPTRLYRTPGRAIKRSPPTCS